MMSANGLSLLQQDRKTSKSKTKTKTKTKSKGSGGKSKSKSKSYRKSAKLLPVFSKKLENSDRHGHHSRNPDEPGHILKLGFGDGGFWDTTPQTFDNQYFKEFASMSYKAKDNCCGNSMMVSAVEKEI